jgi:hypothetical protein
MIALEAFNIVFKDLTEGGCKSILNITDNQALRPPKEYPSET